MRSGTFRVVGPQIIQFLQTVLMSVIPRLPAINPAFPSLSRLKCNDLPIVHQYCRLLQWKQAGITFQSGNRQTYLQSTWGDSGLASTLFVSFIDVFIKLSVSAVYTQLLILATF